MSRGIKGSGGSLHVAMVKATTVRMVNRFESLTSFHITYEERWSVRIQFGKDRTSIWTNVRGLEFRPDIALRHNPERDNPGDYSYNQEWKGIEYSSQIIFEIETNPNKIFTKDRLKLEYYDRIRKEENHGRFAFAFVLVVREGAKLPADTSPFDEIWKLSDDEIIPFLEESS